MQIRNFNYFDNQQVAGSKDSVNMVTTQDFDLDLQTINRSSQESTGPVLQGSGHFWCHTTDQCTGQPCVVILSAVVCK